MSTAFSVQLIFGFEKSGVLLDVADEASRIATLDFAHYQALKSEQVITAGMIPKLDNAFAALKRGVRQVRIGQAEHLPELVAGETGTLITMNEDNDEL